MSDSISNTAILFEYDKPLKHSDFLNYSGGIWFWTLTPGVITVTDDNGNTGYYDNQNTAVYQVASVQVDGTSFTAVSALADLLTTDEAFYYDGGSTKLYIKFLDSAYPLTQKIFIGVVAGFSKNAENPYYNNIYYDPRLDSIFGIKKSKDPLFYGMLKFNSGNVKIINNDAALDDWRSRNLYRQACRILIGENGSAYSTYEKVFSGIIGNNSRTWQSLSVKVDDIRAGLTNPLPVNQVFKSSFPTMTDDGFFKPIAYGDIRSGNCYCLNETPSGGNHTFLFMDTEFNNATSISEVRVDGVAKATVSVDLAAGTFVLSSANVGTNFGSVVADFTGANIKNGVDIIKDLMKNYANVDYLSVNYDLTETAAAQLIARDTCVYVKSQEKLNKTIEQICVDIDALFFAHDDGTLTVRVYDYDRVPVKQIYEDEWIGEPDTEGNEDEFLSSVIIKYNRNRADDKYIEYNETSYIDEVFDNYKSAQSKEIVTNLTTEADAILKAQTVMESSKLVEDIVKRTTHFGNRDLEIMDFIICDPVKRFDGMEHLGIWEIIGINKDLDGTPSIQLTMRYIKSYTPPFNRYSVRITDDGKFRTLSDCSTRITQE